MTMCSELLKQSHSQPIVCVNKANLNITGLFLRFTVSFLRFTVSKMDTPMSKNGDQWSYIHFFYFMF